MARKSRRFSYSGPFKGLKGALQVAADDPAYFISSSNMETHDGKVRPRGGYTRYTTWTSPTDPLYSAASVRTTNLIPWDDLIFVTDGTPSVFWRRCFREAGNTGVTMIQVSQDAMNGYTPTWTFSPGAGRFSSYIAGNRCYFVNNTVSDNVYVYERERISTANTDGAEAEGTADGGSSSTIRLDTIGGSTSEDITYTFMQCEIELLSGTGAGQRRMISAYDHTGGASERLATVTPNWTTTPDTTTTYRIYRIWFRTAGLAAPVVTFTATGSNSTGTWVAGQVVSYKMTYYDTHTGLESNGGTAAVVTLAGAEDTITVAPGTLPTTVYGNTVNAASHTGIVANKLRYYRQIQSDGEIDWVFLAEKDMGTAATVANCTLTDDRATTPEVTTVPVTHGYPPYGGFGCYHKGRAFISDLNGSGVNYSEADDPISGLGAEYFYQPAFLLQGVEPITWLSSSGEEMLVWQERRVFRCETSQLPDDPFVSQITGMEGTSNGFTVALAKGSSGPPITYYATMTGIYAYDGSGARKISDDIGTLMYLAVINHHSFHYASGVYDPNYDRYLLFYDNSDSASVTTASATTVNGVFVFNAKTQGWDKWTMPTGTAGSVRSALMGLDITRRPTLFLGFNNGRVGYWGSPHYSETTTDDGTAIAWSCQTPLLELGDPTEMKHIHEVAWQWYGGTSLTCTIGALLEYNASLLTSASRTISSSNLAAQLAVGADSRHIQIQLSGSAATTIWLTGFTVTYSPRRKRF